MLIDQISYPCSYWSEELSEDGIRKVIFQLEESEFTLDNPHFGILQIVLGTLEDTLYLPKRCIVWIDNKPYVYLIDEYGFKNPNAVILGIEVDDNYQIISGIQEGDKVALN